MKCKRIFAMLLALCMVLSTFVSVSAGNSAVEIELAAKNVAGTLEDGVYTVTEAQLRAYAGSTTTYDNCGYQDWLKIIPATELDPEKTIKVSFEIELENLINSLGNPYANRTVRLRARGASGDVAPADTYKATVLANTGVAQLVEFEIPVADLAGLDHFGVNVDMQGPLASAYGENEYFKISNVVIEYVGEEEPELPPEDPELPPEEPELPPEEPELPTGDITFTLERGVNAGTNGDNAFPAVGEVEEGVFSTTLAEVRAYTVARNGDNEANYGGDCGYNPWVNIMLDEELQASDDWFVSFDLTTDGIINSLGNEYETLEVRTRFYNGDTELCGNSVHLQNVTVNTDEPVNVGVQVDTTQVTGAVTKIGIAVNVGNAVKYNTFEGSDAYFTIGNVVVDMGEYVAPELPPEEPELPPEEPELPPEEPELPPEEPEEPGESGYFNVVEINAPLDDASEITWKGSNVTVENAAEEIGGRTGVVKATGVANDNNGTVGLLIGRNFAFMPGDTLTYSFDVYLESSKKPVIWIRRHSGELVPFMEVQGTQAPANTWTTVTKTLTYEQLGTYDPAKAPQGWQTPGLYALYLRGDYGTVYIDNFSIVIEREFVPTIESVELIEAGADIATFRVTADGAIDIDSLVDYILVDGVEVNAENVTVEAEDELNTLVTVVGFAPNTSYTFAVTGAKNANNRNVPIADEDACTVDFATIAEVDTDVALTGNTFTYSLTNNLAETETIYIVLLRCKGNTVIETVAVPVEAETGEPVSDSITVDSLGNGEYYRFFAWTYDDGAINSMANLIDLD